jgi:hypothetical protein
MPKALFLLCNLKKYERVYAVLIPCNSVSKRHTQDDRVKEIFTKTIDKIV